MIIILEMNTGSCLSGTAEALKRRNIPVQLLPGMEVFSTPDLPELLADRKIITLNGSRYLLMEFNFRRIPDLPDGSWERWRSWEWFR